MLGFCRENHPGGGGSEGKKEGYVGAKRRRVLGLWLLVRVRVIQLT